MRHFYGVKDNKLTPEELEALKSDKAEKVQAGEIVTKEDESAAIQQ